MDEIKLFVDKKERLEFDIDIKTEQNIQSKPIVRFVLENNDVNFSFEASKEGSKYVVEIPEMQQKLNGGKYSCFLEVIVDNRYFVPWKNSIILKESITITPNIVARVIEQPTVKATVVKVKPTQQSKKIFEVKYVNGNKRKFTSKNILTARRFLRKNNVKYKEVNEIKEEI